MTSLALLPDPSTPLSRESARQAFADILDGRASEQGIAEFLIRLSDRGETSLEIAEAARSLRERLIPIDAPAGAIDVCGTGGDGHHTLNVSTAVALVVAAAGVPVAKHGNRAMSSRSGAADVLASLGVKLDLTPAQVGRCVAEAGIGFMFAPSHHPAMKNVGPTRVELATRTIFNLLGPLSDRKSVV